MRFKFDARKAIEVILYVAHRAPEKDIYHVLKIMYFADKKHLERYGRFICGDRYVAMKHGPVPSGAYDIIKCVRDNNDDWIVVANEAQEAFEMKGNEIVTKREPDVKLLSESEEECLQEAIEEYGTLSFNELRQKSHDAAYESVDENDYMSLEDIAKTLRDGDLIISYLREKY